MVLAWFRYRHGKFMSFQHLDNYFSSPLTVDTPKILFDEFQGLKSLKYFKRVLKLSLINLGAIMAGAADIPAFRSMRTLRALRPLRAVSRWEGMRVSRPPGMWCCKRWFYLSCKWAFRSTMLVYLLCINIYSVSRDFMLSVTMFVQQSMFTFFETLSSSSELKANSFKRLPTDRPC